MFPNLSRLAKVSLTISHKNAVAERGFSVNAAVLSKDRMSLDEKTMDTSFKTYQGNRSTVW